VNFQYKDERFGAMSFTSSVFLFVFFPLSVLGYFLIRKELNNFYLLLISIFFYAYGDLKSIPILLSSVLINCILGICIEKAGSNSKKMVFCLTLGLIYNIGQLFVVKYLIFTVNNINQLLNFNIVISDILLPMGISFFTFKAVSYLVDIFMGKYPAQKNLVDFALYISFFPQIMSGPIVRYNDFHKDLAERRVSLEGMSHGIARFITGLAKKLILSNSFAIVADKAFAVVGTSELSICLSWLGAICYTLQIYYDFSGYSDMAIGIGNLFGFRCRENFDYPYISKSVSEFWRRWHISLGTWFKDYVYFPLGGSRVKTKGRLFFNLFAVWFLTGVWHGANWTFIVWGMFYLVILAFEKFLGYPEKLKRRGSRIIYQIFTLICVMVGWVIFRSSDVKAAGAYLMSMLGLRNNLMINGLDLFLIRDNAILLILGVLFSMPVIDRLRSRTSKRCLKPVAWSVLILLFLVCISYSVNVSYNPFIYFNF